MSGCLRIGINAGGDEPCESVKGAILASTENLDCIVVLYGNAAAIEKIWQKDLPHLSPQLLPHLEICDCGVSASAALGKAVDDLHGKKLHALITASDSRRLDAYTNVVGMWESPYLPALISPIPTYNQTSYFMDAGATSRISDPKIFAEWAKLGQKFLKNLGILSPTFGLANIADKRGAPELVTIKNILDGITGFMGFVEPEQFVWQGKVDLWLMDGYTGNLILKTLEAYLKLITLNHVRAVSNCKTEADQPKPQELIMANTDRLFSYESYIISPYLTNSGLWLFRVHGNAKAKQISQAFAAALQYNIARPMW